MTDRVAMAREAREEARRKIPENEKIASALYEIVEALHDLQSVIVNTRKSAY